MNKRVLIILHPGFEEIEAVTPIDLLVRSDIAVVKSTLGETLDTTGKSGIVIQAESYLKDVADEAFDAVVLPGGPGILKIRKHPIICDLFTRQNAANKLIGCICAAPLLLLDANLLTDVRHTCFPGVKNELSNALEHTVVQDGTIITSRGAGTATQFGLQLIRALIDDATAEKIAASICWEGSV